MVTIQIPETLVKRIRGISEGKENTIGYLFLDSQTKKIVAFYPIYLGEAGGLDAMDTRRETIVKAIATDHKLEPVGYHTKYSAGEIVQIGMSGIQNYKHVYIGKTFIGPLTAGLEIRTFAPGPEDLAVMNDLEKELADLETRLELRAHQAGS